VHKHLPRLPDDFYRGRAWAHWNMTIRDRATGWLDDLFHMRFRESFAELGSARHVGCLAYCLMPDHVHLLLCGLGETSDQRLFIRALRRELGRALAPSAWQKQPYDSVLRENDRSMGALLTVAHYITANPFRAGFVKQPAEWHYRGAWLPNVGWMDPCAADFGAEFWAGYIRLIDGPA
jgi:putative transposase